MTTTQSASMRPYPNPRKELTVLRGSISSFRNSDADVDAQSSASTAETFDTDVSPLTQTIACDLDTAENPSSSTSITVLPCPLDKEVRKLRRRGAIFSASRVCHWLLSGEGRSRDCVSGRGIVFRTVEWDPKPRSTNKYSKSRTRGSGCEEDESVDPLMRVSDVDGGDRPLSTIAERFPDLSGNKLYACHENAPNEDGGRGRVDSETSYAETENLFEVFGKDRYEYDPDGNLRRKLSRVASLRVNMASKIDQKWRKRRRAISQPARFIGSKITTRLPERRRTKNDDTNSVSGTKSDCEAGCTSIIGGIRKRVLGPLNL